MNTEQKNIPTEAPEAPAVPEIKDEHVISVDDRKLIEKYLRDKA